MGKILCFLLFPGEKKVIKLKGYSRYRYSKNLESKIERHTMRYLSFLSPIFFCFAFILFYLDADNFITLGILACLLVVFVSISMLLGEKKARKEIKPEDYQHPLRPKSSPE